jgi:hypothetical protein
MSIYVMTVGELAKRRGEPVGDFVKKVQAVGFDAGSHAKRLTQADLDSIIALLDGATAAPIKREEKKEREKLQNPNVLLVTLPNGKRSVVLVEASIDDLNKVSIQIVEQSTEDSLGEALLEFRKQMGMHMGVN